MVTCTIIISDNLSGFTIPYPMLSICDTALKRETRYFNETSLSCAWVEVALGEAGGVGVRKRHSSDSTNSHPSPSLMHTASFLITPLATELASKPALTGHESDGIPSISATR